MVKSFRSPNDNPIGMFDSGVGGLTVFKQLQKQLPNESVVYFGDTARLPYGDKSKEAITRFSLENSEFLLEQNIKLLVVACNTASAFALQDLQDKLPIPVIGVIEPAVEKVIKTTKNKKIGVLATKGTIQSEIYPKEIESRLPGAAVISVACPLLVPFIEEGWIEHPSLELVVDEYLKSIREEQVDTLLLGCTHYPLIADLISTKVDPSIVVMDSAKACIDCVQEYLLQSGLMNSAVEKPSYQFIVSDDPEKFTRLASRFLDPHTSQNLNVETIASYSVL